MKFHVFNCLASLLWLFVSTSMAASQEGTLQAGFVNPGFHEKPAWFKNSFLDLREDVAEAAQQGKRVMLFFHQDGCPYCASLLNVNYSLKELVDKTQANFEVIAINIWGDREVTDLQGQAATEKAFAAQLKVMYTPTLIFLDEQGSGILRINGYYPPHEFAAALDFVAGRLDRQSSFRDYLAQLKPKPASGVLHRSPDDLPLPLDLSAAGRRARPLLVLMEQKQCAPCDELHGDILRRSEVQQSFKQFDVALVDVWSSEPLTTPDGRQLKATQWAAQQRIQYTPSLLFFDDDGREVFRTDALLKAFHVHAAMDYVLSGAYRQQGNFQRFVQARADALRARGIEPELMK